MQKLPPALKFLQSSVLKSLLIQQVKSPDKKNSNFRPLSMSNIRPLLFWLSVFLFASGLQVSVRALDPQKAPTQYAHRIWTTKDGLPLDSVRQITQSADGYLWLATSEGAVRFDGARFETFNVKNQPTLKSGDYVTILAANDGSVWTGSIQAGAARFINGAVETFTTAEGLAGDEVYSIFQSRDGAVWFGMRNRGISRYKDGKFTNYQPVNYSASVVWQFAETADGSLWAANAGNGVLRFQNETWTTYGAAEGLTAGNIGTLCTDRQNRLWIGGNKGLNVWENGTFTDHTKQIGLNAAPVVYILNDRDDNLWLATVGEGLIRYRDGQSVKMTAADGLANNSLSAIYEDREGSLWVAGESGGLNQFYDGAITPLTTREGLVSDSVSTVLQGKNGDLWFGTNNGISRLSGGKFTNLTTKDGISDKLSQALWETGDGALWIGTGTQGVNRLMNGRIENFGERDGFPRSYIRAIRETRNGDLWIAMEKGLLLWRENEKTFFTTANGLIDNAVRVLLETPEGDLWLGTQGGLQKFGGANPQTLTTQNGLPGNIIISLHSDADGILWVGTDRGLARIDRSLAVKSVTTGDGLFHDTIHGIISDDAGNLWLSCATGIFRVSKSRIEQLFRGEIKKIESVHFNTADGMKSAEVGGDFQPAVWRAADGNLWFPTNAGAIVIDPRNLRENKNPPGVLIEEVLFDEKRQPSGEKLNVPSGVFRVDFRFTAPSFRAPNKLKFQYQLTGYDRDWHDAEAGKRQISYTNLPPGNYDFRVRAANENGVWNETGASLAFSVAPRFYQTWWFYLLCALLIGAIAFLLYRLRLRQIKNRFALVLAERTRIAREIHDTLAQGFVGTTLQLEAAEAALEFAPAQAKEHLAQAKTLAKSSLTEARHSIWELRQENHENFDLPLELKKFAARATAKTAIKANIKIIGSPCKLPELVEHNLFRIGQEAITNAIKHSQANLIEGKLIFTAETVALRVSDDGRGFDTDQTNGGGFGLRGANERAAIIGADVKIESRIGAGTKLEVTIKINDRR
jgi:ligand-binding sensor domain-containing protein/anti-sigma regulatory factor (Ser/Thr protein kinase)